MSRYVINILASQDLNQIADYFAKTNLEAGEQFFSNFNRKCKQLVTFPNSGKRYDEIRLAPHGSLIFERGGHIGLESINEAACSDYDRTS